MSDSSPPLSKMMVETLIKGLQEAKNSIQSLQDQEHANELQLVEMKGQLTNISEVVTDIKKLVRGNNGKDSMTDRISKLEGEQKSINQFVIDYKAAKKEKIQGKWQLRGIWVASTLGMLGGIGAAIISLLGN